MPYYHCSKCHHEWEGSQERVCDWCGAVAGRVLEEKTPLERMIMWINGPEGKEHKEKFIEYLEGKKDVRWK